MAVVLSWERRAACLSIQGPRTEFLVSRLGLRFYERASCGSSWQRIVKHGRVYSNIDSGEARTGSLSGQWGVKNKVMEREENKGDSCKNLSSAHEMGRRIKDNGRESTCNR